MHGNAVHAVHATMFTCLAHGIHFVQKNPPELYIIDSVIYGPYNDESRVAMVGIHIGGGRGREGNQ